MLKKSVAAILLAAAVMIAVLLFSACGDTQTGVTPDETSDTAETTVVLETTVDGGTVEQDAEGNKITKDKDGKVTAVEDKTGHSIDVVEYVTTHSWVETSGSAGSGNAGSGDPGSNAASGNGGSAASKPADSGNSGSGENTSSAVDDNGVEEDIPVIIATMPDDDDLIELPVL